MEKNQERDSQFFLIGFLTVILLRVLETRIKFQEMQYKTEIQAPMSSLCLHQSHCLIFLNPILFLLKLGSTFTHFSLMQYQIPSSHSEGSFFVWSSFLFRRYFFPLVAVQALIKLGLTFFKLVSVWINCITIELH